MFIATLKVDKNIDEDIVKKKIDILSSETINQKNNINNEKNEYIIVNNKEKIIKTNNISITSKYIKFTVNTNNKIIPFNGKNDYKRDKILSNAFQYLLDNKEKDIYGNVKLRTLISYSNVASLIIYPYINKDKISSNNVIIASDVNKFILTNKKTLLVVGTIKKDKYIISKGKYVCVLKKFDINQYSNNISLVSLIENKSISENKIKLKIINGIKKHKTVTEKRINIISTKRDREIKKANIIFNNFHIEEQEYNTPEKRIEMILNIPYGFLGTIFHTTSGKKITTIENLPNGLYFDENKIYGNILQKLNKHKITIYLSDNSIIEVYLNTSSIF